MGDENVVRILESILNTNWNEENVTKPQIIAIDDAKRVDIAAEDLILIYATSALLKSRGDLAYNTEDKQGFVTLDVRTTVSETRYTELVTEIDRIRKLKRRDPHTDWDLLLIPRSKPDHRAGSWRGILDFQFTKWNEAL